MSEPQVCRGPSESLFYAWVQLQQQPGREALCWWGGDRRAFLALVSRGSCSLAAGIMALINSFSPVNAPWTLSQTGPGGECSLCASRVCLPRRGRAGLCTQQMLPPRLP